MAKSAKYFTISVDGGWSNWSNYGECSKSCGKGKKYKYRTCTNPPQSGDGKDCYGRARKGKKCREASCKGRINPSISF